MQGRPKQERPNLATVGEVVTRRAPFRLNDVLFGVALPGGYIVESTKQKIPLAVYVAATDAWYVNTSEMPKMVDAHRQAVKRYIPATGLSADEILAIVTQVKEA